MVKNEFLISSTTVRWSEMDLSHCALRANHKVYLSVLLYPFSSGGLHTMIPKWASGGGSLVVSSV